MAQNVIKCVIAVIISVYVCIRKQSTGKYIVLSEYFTKISSICMRGRYSNDFF